MDYNDMVKEINILCDKYSFLSVNSIGESILGKEIHLIGLGTGKKQIMYIGAQSGNDCLSSEVLCRFIKDYCEAYMSGSKIYGIPIEYLYKKVCISVLPMINPDGVDYCINGVASDNPLTDRVLRMNGQSRDFSLWCANARGVDLRYNYDSGYFSHQKEMMSCGIYGGAPSGYCGEGPRSEPETGALSNYIRYSGDVCAVVELSLDDKAIFCSNKVKSNRGLGIFAQMCSRTVISEDCNGELCRWCVEELSLPCVRLGIGRGNDTFAVYTELRRMLFSAPNLFE